MPIQFLTFRLTIIAHNVYEPGQISWHGLFTNILGTRCPRCRHRLMADNCLFANRTSIIKACKLSKAMCVYCVTAGQILWRLTRCKHIFPAYWTIVFVLVFHAVVCVVDTDTNAHAALFAMPVWVLTSHTAETTLCAVKGLLRLLHPKIANIAIILGKSNTAVHTLVPYQLHSHLDS